MLIKTTQICLNDKMLSKSPFKLFDVKTDSRKNNQKIYLFSEVDTYIYFSFKNVARDVKF